MTPRHLDNLFSSAYEGELTPIEEARFDTHIKSCAPCADAYAEFRSSIEALRELPKARMPHAVHLPSSPPVAEISTRPRSGWRWGWFNLGVLRRFPATAVAGAFVVVLAIAALVHGGGSTTGGSINSAALPALSTPADHGDAGSGTAASCSIVNITGASPPAGFSQEDLATDPAQPALHLTLAAPTLHVAAGKPAEVYAQLSVPVQGSSNPGSTATQLPSRAALPCVSVTVEDARLQIAFAPLFAEPVPEGAGAPGVAPGAGSAGPLFTFQVPAGLAPGTEVHVTATVPAGYAGLNSPALTAELTLTTS